MRPGSLLLYSLVAMGCGDSFGPTTSLSGEWRGTTGGLILQFTISEENELISGDGTLSGNFPTIASGIAGSHNDSEVVLVFSPEGFVQFQFNATYDGCSLAGTFQNGGFHGESYTMTRVGECTPGT